MDPRYIRFGVIAPLCTVFAITAIQPAQADYPRLEGEVVFELENDNTYHSDDDASEINDFYTTTEVDLNAFITKNVYFNVHLTLETVQDPTGDDRFFEDQGAFVEVATANYQTDAYHVFVGKFGPNFSLAYDAAPGVFGSDLPEADLEIAEQIGIGGSFAIGDDGLVLTDANIGRHTFSVSTFFADTTFLNDVFLGKTRGTFELADGGPGNTEDFRSHAFAIDGENIPGMDGFRYHVGYAHRDVSMVFDEDGAPVAPIEDESKFAAAVEWALPVTEDVTVTPLLEFARIENFGGVKDDDRDYVTAAALVEYGPWNLAVAYSGRFIDDATGANVDDYNFQVSVGYTFDFGLTADIGWKVADEGGVDTQVIGGVVTYTLTF